MDVFVTIKHGTSAGIRVDRPIGRSQGWNRQSKRRETGSAVFEIQTNFPGKA